MPVPICQTCAVSQANENISSSLSPNKRRGFLCPTEDNVIIHLKIKPLPAYNSATSTSCRKCGAKLKQGKLSRGIKCSINLSAADCWSNSTQPQSREEASKRNPQPPRCFHWLLAFNQSCFASLASTVCFLKRVRQTSESPSWQNAYFFCSCTEPNIFTKGDSNRFVSLIDVSCVTLPKVNC